MIYTRFGNRVRIISGNIAKNEVDIIIIYTNKAVHKKTYIHELRADDGIKEIHSAIIKANKEKENFIKGGDKNEKNWTLWKSK